MYTLKKKEQIPFWLFTAGLIIALILPRLVQDGMFTDGVLYAAIAHNLAIGKGSLWFPYFDDCMCPFFHQQPPLTFGIQAWFFKAFGSSMYVERGYSFLTACLSAGLIVLLWRTIAEGRAEQKRMGWLPVLLWIIIPVCFWAYCNNMEENTMGVFTLLSSLLIYAGLRKDNWKKLVLITIGAAVTVPASLCKGFPGFFPIAIPALYFLIIRPERYPNYKAVLFSLLAVVVPFVIYLFLFFDNYVYDSLTAYMHDRVLNSIEHVSNVSSRFYLIGQLFSVELMPPVIIAVAVLLFSGMLKNFKKHTNQEYRRKILLFFCIGVSASFPLIITKEQRGFYLVPSFPYYAIALALISYPGVAALVGKIDMAKWYRRLLLLSVAFIVTGLGYSYMQVGKTGHDKEDLHDIYAFGKIIPDGTDICVYSETWNNWALHNYFVRYYNISLATDTASGYTYFMLEKSLHRPLPHGYTDRVEQGVKYDLYKKQ